MKHFSWSIKKKWTNFLRNEKFSPMALYTIHAGSQAKLGILYTLDQPNPIDSGIRLAFHNNRESNDSHHDKWLVFFFKKTSLNWREIVAFFILKKLILIQFIKQNKMVSITYDQCRTDHPSLLCKYTRMKHYSSHAGSRAMECNDHTFHHRNLNYSDTRPVFYNSHAWDRIPFDKSERRTDHLAILWNSN